jgi:CheY-like chemotaxis protein
MKPKLNCVLIIDDDEPTNFFTNIILEESGCVNHIRMMQSGKEALDYLIISDNPAIDPVAHPSPDLIFLDINMPVMDGWEFINEYKKLKMQERVIVVMLTTSLFPEDKLKAEAMGEISGFENKPLTVEKINRIVEKYFALQVTEEKTQGEVPDITKTASR